jgi:hypothetical protein
MMYDGPGFDIIFRLLFGGVVFLYPTLFDVAGGGVSVIGRYSGLEDGKTSNKKTKGMRCIKSRRTGEIGVFA